MKGVKDIEKYLYDYSSFVSYFTGRKSDIENYATRINFDMLELAFKRSKKSIKDEEWDLAIKEWKQSTNEIKLRLGEVIEKWKNSPYRK
jgi:hypothetical protein